MSSMPERNGKRMFIRQRMKLSAERTVAISLREMSQVLALIRSALENRKGCVFAMRAAPLDGARGLLCFAAGPPLHGFVILICGNGAEGAGPLGEINNPPGKFSDALVVAVVTQVLQRRAAFVTEIEQRISDRAEA